MSHPGHPLGLAELWTWSGVLEALGSSYWDSPTGKQPSGNHRSVPVRWAGAILPWVQVLEGAQQPCPPPGLVLGTLSIPVPCAGHHILGCLPQPWDSASFCRLPPSALPQLAELPGMAPHPPPGSASAFPRPHWHYCTSRCISWWVNNTQPQPQHVAGTREQPVLLLRQPACGLLRCCESNPGLHRADRGPDGSVFLGEGCQVLGAAGCAFPSCASLEGAIFRFEKMQQKAHPGFATEGPGPQPCTQLLVVCLISQGVSTQIHSTGCVLACCPATGLSEAAPALAEWLAEPWREPNKLGASPLTVPLLQHGCQADWAQARAAGRAGSCFSAVLLAVVLWGLLRQAPLGATARAWFVVPLLSSHLDLKGSWRAVGSGCVWPQPC